MKKSKILSLILSFCLVLPGCSNNEGINQTSSETQEASQTEETVAEESSNEISGGINPLTGESGFNEDAVGKRPVAVMVSNIKAALPQYGVDEADIIYEIPVEGGITRLLAVYADYTNVPDICSVRSCRYYYPLIAYGMDAIYCHWGTDKTIALDTLNSLDIERFDGNESSLGYGTVFERDEERMAYYDTEHTGCLRGSQLPEAIEEMGYRTDINDTNASGAFNFNDPDETIEPQGVNCTNPELEFSLDYYSTFEYDSESKTYLKYHSGSPHTDGVTGNQLAFTNLLVLETSVSQISNDSQLMSIGLDGGSGYYISMGKAQNISWSKFSDDSPIEIFDENGEEISLNAGKIYIGMIQENSTTIE